MNYLGWLFDPAHWTGSDGIPTRLVEHLGYVALTMIVALVVAVPIGAWVGHTGRGGFLVVGSANALRALPTLGVLILLVTPFGLSILGPLVALIVLAIPPMLGGHLRRACATSIRPWSTPPAAWACAAARCCGGSSCPTRSR